MRQKYSGKKSLEQSLFGKRAFDILFLIELKKYARISNYCFSNIDFR